LDAKNLNFICAPCSEKVKSASENERIKLDFEIKVRGSLSKGLSFEDMKTIINTIKTQEVTES
jgi:hypothetical protein